MIKLSTRYGAWKNKPNFIFYQINNSFFSKDNINYLEYQVACQLWKVKIQQKNI